MFYFFREKMKRKRWKRATKEEELQGDRTRMRGSDPNEPWGCFLCKRTGAGRVNTM